MKCLRPVLLLKSKLSYPDNWILSYAEHVDAEKTLGLIRLGLEIITFSTEKSVSSSTVSYTVSDWNFSSSSRSHTHTHSKFRSRKTFGYRHTVKHLREPESLRAKFAGRQRIAERETDLSVLDLRVGHRWGHQLEGCHESSGVALHLSGDLDLTGSHRGRLSTRLPAARSVFFQQISD